MFVMIVSMFNTSDVIAQPHTSVNLPEWEVVDVIPLNEVPYANGIAINQDDTVLYVNGRSGAVVAIDTNNFNILASTQLPVNAGADSLGDTYLLPDESAIVEIDEHGAIFFLAPTTLAEIPPRLHPSTFQMAITDDSQLGITAGSTGVGPGYVRFYDLKNHELLYSLSMDNRQYVI